WDCSTNPIGARNMSAFFSETMLAVPVSEREHIRGRADAPVTMVEYGDYECPFCGQAYYVIAELLRIAGDQFRFAFRNFPLVEVHPHAEHAAEEAEAAGAHGKFWEMHETLFEHQRALDDAHLIEYASRLGLDVNRFRTELKEHAYLDRIR